MNRTEGWAGRALAKPVRAAGNRSTARRSSPLAVSDGTWTITADPVYMDDRLRATVELSRILDLPSARGLKSRVGMQVRVAEPGTRRRGRRPRPSLAWPTGKSSIEP